MTCQTDADALLPIYNSKEVDVPLSHPPQHNVGRLGKHNGHTFFRLMPFLLPTYNVEALNAV